MSGRESWKFAIKNLVRLDSRDWRDGPAPAPNIYPSLLLDDQCTFFNIRVATRTLLLLLNNEQENAALKSALRNSPFGEFQSYLQPIVARAATDTLIRQADHGERQRRRVGRVSFDFLLISQYVVFPLYLPTSLSTKEKQADSCSQQNLSGFQCGTKILKYDNSVVQAEDVEEGDELLGPDGKPRRVVVRVFGGKEPLFRIKLACKETGRCRQLRARSGLAS